MKSKWVNFNFILLVLLMSSIIFSCSVPEGEGGNSTIRGKVHTTNYNSSFSTILSEFPSPEQDVYIIYGNDLTYSNRIRTSPDGIFEFKYLRKGKYTIYVYSKDKAAYLAGNGNAPVIAVYKSGEITSKKQTVDFGTLEIIE
jgi:hypothetical protein